MSPVDTSIGYT